MATDRRTHILDRLADHLLAQGLTAARLKSLATAAGTSDRMLLYYFSDKAELIAATLVHIAGRLDVVLSALAPCAPQPAEVLTPALFTLLRGDALWPYMRLWLEIAALAAQGDAVCRNVGAGIARGFEAWIAARLLPSAARGPGAAQLLVTLEGLLVLHGLGLDAMCAEALGGVGPTSLG